MKKLKIALKTFDDGLGKGIERRHNKSDKLCVVVGATNLKTPSPPTFSLKIP